MSRIHVLLCFFFAILLSCMSCSQNDAGDFFADMEERIASDPYGAVEELKRMKPLVEQMPDDTRNRYHLLCIKAEDKAYILHTSDSTIKSILPYFELHGSPEECMEAYYYMGSTYRDMHNLPEAVRWYRKASDYGDRHLAEVDTSVVCNINAQLAHLLGRQRNYRQAYDCLRRNYLYTMGNSLNNKHIYEMAHAYKFLWYNTDMKDSLYADSARHFFMEMRDKYFRGDTEGVDISHFAEGQIFLVEGGYKEEAKDWLNTMESLNTGEPPLIVWVAKGYFYKMIDIPDSTAYYWRYCYEHTSDPISKKDAAYFLFRLFEQEGAKDSMLHYSKAFADASDSATLYSMWELTTDANNEYLYNRNIEEEAEARDRSTKLTFAGIITFLISISLFLISILYNKQRVLSLKNRNTKLLLETERMNTKNMQLESSMREKDMVQIAEEMMEEPEKRSEIANTDLYKKLERMSCDAGNPIIEYKDWKEMRSIITQYYPNFMKNIIGRSEDVDSTGLHILCLLKIGCTQKMVCNLLGMKKSALSRRLGRLEQKLGCKWEEL